MCLAQIFCLCCCASYGANDPFLPPVEGRTKTFFRHLPSLDVRAEQGGAGDSSLLGEF